MKADSQYHKCCMLAALRTAREEEEEEEEVRHFKTKRFTFETIESIGTNLC